jgi:Ca-activated chloride channel homolog
MDQHSDDSPGAQEEFEAAVRPRWSAGKTAVLTFALGGAAAAAVHFGDSPHVSPWSFGDETPMEPEVRLVEAGTIEDFLGEEFEAKQEASAGRRHRGEEGKMGRPAPTNKSGLFAMKGPKDAVPYLARGTVGNGRVAGALGDVTLGLRATAGEGYATVDEQAFMAVADDARSTFAVDVDTASYSNTRRFLRGGVLPPAESVRIEEYVNYFDYDYDAPTGDTPFSVQAEVGPCPWAPTHKLVHLGLQGRVIDQADVPARNLVFLLDVSGSMAQADKLPLLVRSLELLVDRLRPEDRVGIVVYAGASGVVLDPTSGTHRAEIKDALNRLHAGGSTNGGAGIELAYRLAQRHFVEGGINRVVLATDGDFNVGVDSLTELQALIEAKRASGVFLSVLGFGTGNVQDATMELLADKGNGNYAYIDTEAEARKVLVTEAGGTLVTIAKDVKLQVEFNPAVVASWRLVGYDNRRLAHADFQDDRKDAGEIGAGHSVTALYEIVPVDHGDDAARTALTVALRYKRPDGERSTPLDVTVPDRDADLASTSDDFRFSAAVAEFGLLLRRSAHTGTASWDEVARLAAGARGADPGCLRGEFLELVQTAAKLAGAPVDPISTCAS